MKTLRTTVLSGFLGSGKTTLLRRILENKKGMKVAVIVNDMAEVNIDASLVAHGSALSQTEEKLVEMTNGCICCTLREDLLVQVRSLALENRFDYLLIESTGISEPMPVAATFTFEDENGESLARHATLDTMVTMIDTPSFFDNYLSEEMLSERKEGASDDDERTIVDLLVDQLEFANVIILNKCDIASEEEIRTVRSLVAKLNPAADIIETSHADVPFDTIINTGLFDMEKASQMSGWAQELQRGENSSHTPETEEYGISSLTYRKRRPFHPQRFWNFIQTPWDGVLRAKGFFWLASRMAEVGLVSQAGRVRTHGFAGFWYAAMPESILHAEVDPVIAKKLMEGYEWGDRRQEIVFIGQNLNKEALARDLDACLLTDDEMRSGEELWRNLPDPFPKWVPMLDEHGNPIEEKS